MIYVLYSGDYEVFMGGNYLPESKVLLEPTDVMLDVFESIEVPVTLFADLLCLWRYRELGLREFPDQVDEQLRNVVRRGHDVQMHIHPHWPKTDIDRREDGSTHYNFEKIWMYPGPHFENLYGFMLEHLQHGKEYLNSLLKEVLSDYECLAYRAGAYGIVPGEKEILAALEDAGYLIDSSVVPGYPGIGETTGPVNFHNVPKQGNYRLSRKSGLTQPAEKGLFEIPVAATMVHGIMPQFHLKLKSLRKHLFGKQNLHANLGYTANEGFRHNRPTAKQSLVTRAKRIITRGLSCSHWGMMDITTDTRAMLDVTHGYIKKYQNESKDLFFCVSFHPKDYVPSKQEAIEKYHRKLQRNYGDNISAITFRQAADLIAPQSNN